MNLSIQTALHNLRAGPLGERYMRRYQLGQLVSLTGVMLQMAVLGILIRDIESNKADAAASIGRLWMMGFLPGILIAPFAGVLLDRCDMRRVLQFTGLVATMQAFTLAFMTYHGHPSIFWINTLALCAGFVTPIDSTARNAIIKLITKNPENVTPANMMFTSLYNLAQLVGPSIACWLIATFNYTGTFILNGLTFVTLILTLCWIQYGVEVIPHAKRPERKNILGSLTHGGHYIFTHSGILVRIVMAGTLSSLWFGIYAILYVVTEDLYGGTMDNTKHVYSTLTASSGIGAFIGALLAIWGMRRVPIKKFTVFGTVAMGIGLILFANVKDPRYGMVIMFLSGLGFMSAFTTFRGSIQALVDHNVIGVASGFIMSSFYLSITIGTFTIGSCMHKFGAYGVVSTIGAICIVAGLLIPRLPGLGAAKPVGVPSVSIVPSASPVR